MLTSLLGCEKCGCQFIRVRYDAMRDRLRKTCERCGYAWDEKPLGSSPLGDSPRHHSLPEKQLSPSSDKGE